MATTSTGTEVRDTDRVRVLQLIARMNVGGPATQVLALAEHLDPERFEVIVATGDVGDGEADHLALRAPDLQVRRVTGLGRSVKAGSDLKAAGAVRRLLADVRPDVVHTHTAKAGVLGRTMAARAGLPTVHTFHGHLLHGYFRPSITRAVAATERRMSRRTAASIVVGAQVRDDLLAAGIGRADTMTVIPPGVPVPDAPDRAEARRLLQLSDDRPVIGAVGRLTGIKRPDRLLDAVARAAPRLEAPPVVLLAGDGELRTSLEARARALRLDVRFLGWRGDVGTVHAACDVAALASDNEGMPVALIEAAHLGVPAVATDVGSVREVVVDEVTGRVVAASAEALGDALVEVLADPDRLGRWGSAARDHAADRFSPQAMAAAHADVYDRVTARR